MTWSNIWWAVELEAVDEIGSYAASKGNMNVSRRSVPKTNLLIHAMENDAYQSFRLLLELGANPNATTRSGQTAMHISTKQNDTKWLKALIEHGGDVDGWNNTIKQLKGTPLMYGATSRHPITKSLDNPWALEMVKVLVANGAGVNKRSGEYLDNESPIVAAGNRCRFHIVLYLLENGADYGKCGPPPTGLLNYLEGVHSGSFPDKFRHENYLKVVNWIEQDAKSRGDEATVALLYKRAREVAEFKKKQRSE